MGRFVCSVRHLSCSLLTREISLLGLVLALGLAASTATAANPTQLKLISSTRDAVRFSLADLPVSWRPVVVRQGADSLYDVSLSGFTTAGAIGGPRLPVRGGWLMVPPGTRPEVVVIAEDWTGAQARPLLIEPVPVVVRNEATGEADVSNVLVLPGESIPPNLDVPAGALAALAKRRPRVNGSALTLGDVGWWRGHRVVPYRLTGVQVNAANRAQRVLVGGTWEVRFVPEKASTSAEVPRLQRQRLANRHDAHFSSIFLNGELASQLPTEAAFYGFVPTVADKAATAARGQQKGTLLGFESRLAVTKTKLHRVTYARLRSRNLLPDVPIQESQIRLYQRRYLAALDDGSGAAPYVEVEVPIEMVGEGDAFDGDDFFIFYGSRLRDDVAYTADLGSGLITVPGAGDPHEQSNDFNVFWLAASEASPGQPWARMGSITLPPSAGTPMANYRRTDYVEEQAAFRENVPNYSADRLYLNNFWASEVSAAVNPLSAPDPAGGSVEVRVGITGWNTLPRHLHLDLLTGDAVLPLEDYTLTTMSQDVVRSFAVTPADINASLTRVSMTAQTPGATLFSYMNWVSVSYDALYQATNNRIDFNLGSVAGARPIEVSGFADSDLKVYDITDPHQPVRVALGAGNVVATGATWKLSLLANQASGQQRQFVAVGHGSTDGIDEFVTFRSKPVPDPVVPTAIAGGPPDLIVITHADFRDAIGRWVDHRIARSGGQLRVHVVDVQDLYDWYSGGLKDAWAIKRFTNHAITQWGSWSLMIVGDANENALEKEVPSSARGYSTDWVPTHYHVQHASTFAPELMASDKWYTTMEAGTNYPQDNFPNNVNAPWDMYCGRFPCNNVTELNNMIDKVITVENVQDGQTWRRRGIFFADDEWSNGLGVQALSELTNKGMSELQFGISELDSLGPMWATGTGAAATPLDSVVILLKPYMDAVFPDPTLTVRGLGEARDFVNLAATPALLRELSAGGLVVHYQGHANPYVLSSEFWLQDRVLTAGRRDISSLGNTGKPWFFMGMGCHIADWAQNNFRTPFIANESSLAEKMLTLAQAGASAVYASSGFEFIVANRVFGEAIFRRWRQNPPSSFSTGGHGMTSVRSRWVTGELMWAAEADMQAVLGWAYPYTEMISQYMVFGDPLMVLDAGPAQVAVTLLGPPDALVSGTVDLVANDAANQRTVLLVARDEAGIDRLEVISSDGTDLTSQIAVETLPDGASNHTLVNYRLDVPVLPYDHNLTVRVFDTGGALPTDRHYELVLNMPQTAAFVAAGVAVDPDLWVFQANQPVDFTAHVVSSAQLGGATETTLTSATLTLSNVVISPAVGRELDLSFTATAASTDAAQMHAVTLTIDGSATELVIQTGSGVAPVVGIERVFNYPNPMSDETRFIFESSAAAGPGLIRVFSVAGRAVAQVAFDYDGSGKGIVSWQGRDRYGSELGNGTYLYRLELTGAGDPLVSEMQRLVVMR